MKPGELVPFRLPSGYVGNAIFTTLEGVKGMNYICVDPQGELVIYEKSGTYYCIRSFGRLVDLDTVQPEIA